MTLNTFYASIKTAKKMDTEELIDQIVQLSGNNYEEIIPDSFLSVINRDNDEKSASKFIAYIFRKSPNLAQKVVGYYYNEQEISWDPQELAIESIECEKVITDLKRIDIFITLLSRDNTQYCIVIENKIYSKENNGQTNYYSKWLNTNYKDSKRVFIYLKPSWNPSTPINKDFLILTYKDLSAMIDDTLEDYFLLDFKRYVKMKEANNQLSDLDRKLLDNYDAIADIKDRVDNIIKKFKESAKEEVGQQLALEVCRKEKDTIFQFYRDEWYKKKNYYFYVEYKFSSGDLKKIVFQKIIWKDKKSDDITRFLMQKRVSYLELVEDQWFVLGKEEFLCEEPALSQKWTSAFLEQAVETLSRYKREIDDLFAEYITWLQTNQ